MCQGKLKIGVEKLAHVLAQMTIKKKKSQRNNCGSASKGRRDEVDAEIHETLMKVVPLKWKKFKIRRQIVCKSKSILILNYAAMKKSSFRIYFNFIF